MKYNFVKSWAKQSSIPEAEYNKSESNVNFQSLFIMLFVQKELLLHL